MAPQNRAAWIMKKQDPVMVVDSAPYYKPEADEVVIRTKAVAINPADWIIQKMSIIVDTYPAILGCDIAGTVEEVGSAAADSFAPGDRVIGQPQPLPGGIYKHAAFQDYVVLKLPLIVKIPASTAWKDATVLPLAINTSASCIFSHQTLDLTMPPAPRSSKNETLVIWGASSSVGSCGIQLAVAAGYDVFGVASTRNHPLLKSLGASQTFDQSDSEIVNKVIAALKGRTCVGAYDAISTEPTLTALRSILDGANASRKRIAAVMPGAESYSTDSVTVVTNFTCTTDKTHVGPYIWREYLEQALESGVIQYKPDADVVGHGLEDLQKAVDIMSKGVSAKKLVVTM